MEKLSEESQAGSREARTVATAALGVKEDAMSQPGVRAAAVPS